MEEKKGLQHEEHQTKVSSQVCAINVDTNSQKSKENHHRSEMFKGNTKKRRDQIRNSTIKEQQCWSKTSSTPHSETATQWFCHIYHRKYSHSEL